MRIFDSILPEFGMSGVWKVNESEYTEQADALAKEMGLTMKTQYLGLQKPENWGKDEPEHGTWRVTLFKGGKRYTFNFYMSQHDTEENPNKPPSMYDILAAVQKYDPGDFENFCSDFGYDEDSRTAERTFKAVVKEFQNISRLFSPEELEKLQEIA